MKKQYKALMLDLDGTTVPNKIEGLPSKKVVAAIAEASKKVKIGIITGRTYKFASPIMSKLILNAPSIVAGGAQVIDSSSGNILGEKKISIKSARYVEQVLKRLQLPYIYPTNDNSKEIKAGYHSLKNREVLSVGVTDMTSKQADNLLEELQNDTEISKHKIVGWKSGTFWVQITHAAASKQHGILEVAKILGIETHEIIGVGDAYNDFPLLMACGLKVAMGNAVPELKAIADYIAPTVDEDGVVEVIEKFIL